MGQGLPIAVGRAVTTPVAGTTNQVKSTYDYIGPGTLKLYARASAAGVFCDLFINGVQILRREVVIFTGTTGAMDTSAHLIAGVNSLGGRVELVFSGTAGTETIDFLLTHDGIPFGKTISRLLGR